MPIVIALFQKYSIYFLSDKDSELVYVLVSKGKPNSNAAKVLVPAGEDIRLKHNNSDITKQDLTRIIEWISLNKIRIHYVWNMHFTE